MLDVKLKQSAIAGAVLSVLGFSNMAMAENDTTYFQVMARAQVELVNASGDIPELTGEDGFNITDAWGSGRPNNHNWSGIFLDGGHAFTPNFEVFGRLSYNFNMDGLPDGRGKYRDLYLGVRGDFGTVRAGRIETPYKLAGLGWDPMNATSFQARRNAGRSGGGLGHAGYHDDSIDYSFSMNGMKFTAFYSKNDGGPSGPDQNSMYAASVLVPVGSVELSLAHIDADNRGGGKRDGTKLGARYTEGAWTFAGQYEFRGTGLDNGDYVFLTGAYKAAVGQVSLSYGRFLDDSLGAVADGEYVGIGLVRRLSPQFAYHAGVRYTDRDTVGSETMVGLGFRFTYKNRMTW